MTIDFEERSHPRLGVQFRAIVRDEKGGGGHRVHFPLARI